MPSRHLVAIVFSLVLPLCARAADGTIPSAETGTAAPELSTGAVPCTDGADLLATLLADSAPIALSCENRCPFCPDYPDRPPATCDGGGCCIYEYTCHSPCDFDSDCGEMASCWSGCCYYWNR